MKAIISGLILLLAVASPAMAWEPVLPCSDADYALPPPQDDPADHRQFVLPSLAYAAGKDSPRVYGFGIDLVVDEGGRIACLSPGPLDGIDTAKRRGLFHDAKGWRYSTFVLDGKAALVMVTERVSEEMRPARHIPMPTAPLSRISIRLFIAGSSVTMRGDGSAKFVGWNSVDGHALRKVYRVDQGEFAALVERLRSADAWSLAPSYVRRFPDDVGIDTIRIDVDGHIKTIVFFHPELAGMPEAMRHAIDEVEKVARISDWLPAVEMVPDVTPIPPPTPLESVQTPSSMNE